MVSEKVASELEDSIYDPGTAIESLSKEMQRVRTFSLQNKLALDYLLAFQTGVLH